MTVKKKRNDGYNVKRLREILGIKQDALVIGLKMDQSQISRLEGKEIIDDEILTQIANILNILVEAIKNFSEEQAVKVITGNAMQQTITGPVQSYEAHGYTFNPIEKIVELYERLLDAERRAKGRIVDPDSENTSIE